MILTREKRGNGQAGIFCRSIGLVAVMLAALLPASPAWSQEEKVAAPVAAQGASERGEKENPVIDRVEFPGRSWLLQEELLKTSGLKPGTTEWTPGVSEQAFKDLLKHESIKTAKLLDAVISADGKRAVIRIQIEAAEPPMLWMPEAISTYGQGVDDLFWLIFWITGVAWVIVMGLMFYFLIRYRHVEGRDKAHYTHGNNKLEVTWTLATVVILVFIGVIQLWGESGWFNIRIRLPEMGKDTFPVRVYGEQFAWHFNYPGADGKFGEQRHGYIQAGVNPIGLDRDGPGKDDKVLPKLVVPEGKEVLIQLISLGKFNLDTEIYTHPVLHSFFSPHLRLKRDLVPYNEGNIWFKVEAGKGHVGQKLEIVCAELCGEGHSKMRSDFEILDEAGLLKALGYDWNAKPATEFPVVVHYYQEEKDEE